MVVSGNSNDYFRTLAENSRDAIFITDRDQGLNYANQAFERLFDLPISELTGKTSAELFGTQDRIDIVEMCDAAFSSVPIRETLDVVIGGHDRRLEVTLTACDKDEDGVMSIMGIIRDVTEGNRNTCTGHKTASHDASEFSDKIILESPVGMCVFDAETGDCLASNDAAGRIVGGSREELLKQNFRNIPPWQASGLLERAEEALAKDMQAHHEIVVTSTFGKDVAIDCHFAPFQAGGRRMLLLTLTDISERVQVHRIVQQERDLGLAISQTSSLDEVLSTCLDAAIAIAEMDSGGVYLVDTGSGEINLAVQKGFGREFIDLVAHYPADSPHAELIRAGKPVCTHYTKLDRHAEEFMNKEDLHAVLILPILHNNVAIGCLNVTSHTRDDIPEVARAMLESLAAHMGGAIVRLQTERALLESEARFRSYVESAPDGIWVLDADCRAVEINDAACRSLGYGSKELQGRDFFSRTPPEERERVKEMCKRLEDRGEFTAELPLARKDGEMAIFSISGVALADDRFLVFTKDVTDKVNMERELRQSEKMQAIGQLAGGVAHDFNNQLAGIMGYAELLREEVKHDSSLLSYADGIVKGAEHSAKLTSQLLAFSRRGKFVNTHIDVHQTIAEVVGLLQHSIDKKIVIKQEFEAVEAVTVGDPTQLHNALLNLGINASQAMPRGGTLSFTTHMEVLSDSFCRNFSDAARPGPYVRIDVSDTGTGMDEATQKRAFEPFFTTKELGKGTGMGLAAVYGTVKSHGGVLSLHSKVGAGTTVTVYLPQAGSADTTHEASSLESKTMTGKAKILLIDDDAGVQAVGAEMMRSMGHEVTVCANGRDGVEYFKDHWRQTDLVLLDMNMPEMNGEETFAAIKEIDPDAVVLILSGYYSLDKKAQRIIDTGAKGFIQKPFRLSVLSQGISDALNNRC